MLSPPGNYTSVAGSQPMACLWAADKPVPRHSEGQDAIAILVWFDDNGRVVQKRKSTFTYPYHPPSALDIFKRLLRTIAPKCRCPVGLASGAYIRESGRA